MTQLIHHISRNTDYIKYCTKPLMRERAGRRKRNKLSGLWVPPAADRCWKISPVLGNPGGNGKLCGSSSSTSVNTWKNGVGEERLPRDLRPVLTAPTPAFSTSTAEGAWRAEALLLQGEKTEIPSINSKIQHELTVILNLVLLPAKLLLIKKPLFFCNILSWMVGLNCFVVKYILCTICFAQNIGLQTWGQFISTLRKIKLFSLFFPHHPLRGGLSMQPKQMKLQEQFWSNFLACEF